MTHIDPAAEAARDNARTPASSARKKTPLSRKVNFVTNRLNFRDEAQLV